jgi:hypothetical protein
MKLTENDITYKIVGKDEETVSITVAYKAKEYEFELVYNIDLPINSETYALPNAAELNQLIMERAPYGQLEHMITRFKHSAMVDFADIDKLIEKL